MSSEAITRNDLTAILNDVLPAQRSVTAVSYTGTTDTVGLFAIPVSVFNPSTMYLLDVLCLTAGYYAEGKCIYNGQLYARIVRYDGQNYTSGSATVEVSYINK